MRTILDLPDELILEVASLVDGNTIENFAASCKTLFALSEEALAVHRHRKEFSKISVCPFSDAIKTEDTSYGSSFRVLRQLYDDEGLAPYVTDVKIDGLGLGNHTYNDDVGDDFQTKTFDQDEAQIRRATYYDLTDDTLQRMPAFAQEGMSESVASLIRRDHQGAILGLFVCMLPRLKSLYIKNYPYNNLWLAKIMERLASNVVDATSSSGPLTNLTVLDIGYHNLPHRRSGSFEQFKVLCRLPSLRKFRGTALHLLACNRTLTPWLSQLESIELYECFVDFHNIERIFGHVNRLKRLYVHQCEPLYSVSLGSGVHPYLPSLGKWLKRHAYKTLHSLELVDVRGSFTNYLTYPGPLGPLNDFEKLAILEAPVSAFIEPYNHQPPSCLNILGPLRPIATVLPASLGKLTLAPLVMDMVLDANSAIAFERLLRGFNKTQRQALPNLKHIRFKCPQPQFMENMEDLEHTGLRVEWM